jgi:hypothetical protein
MKFKLFSVCLYYLFSGSCTVSVSSFSIQHSGTSHRKGWKEGDRKVVRVESLNFDACVQDSRILMSSIGVAETETSIAILNDDVHEDGLKQSKIVSEIPKESHVPNSLDSLLTQPTTQAIMPLEASPIVDFLNLPIVPHEQVESDNLYSSDASEISISHDATRISTMYEVTEEILSSDTNDSTYEMTLKTKDTSDVESLMANDSPTILSFANDMLIAERLTQLEQQANELLEKYSINSNSISMNKRAASSNKVITTFTMLGIALTTALVVTAPESPLQLDLSFLQEYSIPNV